MKITTLIAGTALFGSVLLAGCAAKVEETPPPPPADPAAAQTQQVDPTGASAATGQQPEQISDSSNVGLEEVQAGQAGTR